MRKRNHRITAMALAAMMTVSSLSAGFDVTALASEGVTFPNAYTKADITTGKAAYQAMTEDEREALVQGVVKAMTSDEKWMFLSIRGTGQEGNAGDLPGVARLGVPRIKFYDGPAGLLYLEDTTNPPQEELLAATWSEDMAYLYGTIYSAEGTSMGGAMYLSAQLDIQRHPFWNRTKDQMGADSFLLASLADDLVQGMQSEGGIANLKHFAVASDEGNLMNDVSQRVDEQTLHEVYLPGFESAIKKGGALSVMTGYNKTYVVKGDGTEVIGYSSDNTYLLQDVLRKMWNYTGLTITDWGGNHSFTVDDGTDIEAPSGNNNNYTKAAQLVADGTYTQEEMDAMVDESVSRILRAYAAGGYLGFVQLDEDGVAKEGTIDGTATTINYSNGGYNIPALEVIDTPADSEALKAAVSESTAKSQKIAEEGAVLLKNENDALPIKEGTSVAMIGTNATSLIPGIGGERSYGTVSQMTSPYEALADILGSENVSGYAYNDLIGTIIPSENLYTTADGEEHGAIRTYGTGAGEESGEVYQGQYHSTAVTATVHYGDAEKYPTGKLAATDATIDFNTGDNTVAGYKYDTAKKEEFGNGSAYTWNTYIQTEEAGSYDIILQSIGATASLELYELGEAEDGSTTTTKLGSCSGVSNNQGTNWYSSDVPTKTGQSVSKVTKELKADTRYLVIIACANSIKEKDMQVGLAWVTPNQKQANIDDAVKAAETNDTVVIFQYTGTASTSSTIASTSLKLSSDKENMIIKLATAAKNAGKKVVVVLNNPQQIVMENWIDLADAVLEMYYPGQGGGEATANLLSGKVNPSGHLAWSIPAKDTDTIVTYSQEAFDNFKKELKKDDANTQADDETDTEDGFPDFGGGGFPGGGFPGGGTKTSYIMDYSEGIFTDYRFFDQQDITPAYDFGHGLSYTTFEYSDVTITLNPNADDYDIGYDVTFTVKNTGDVAGKDVAQLYLGAAQVPEGIQMAEYQLAGFVKTDELAAGESKQYTIHVSQRALSYWDATETVLTDRADGTSDKWTVAEGERAFVLAQSEADVESAAAYREVINVQQSDVEKASLAAQKADKKAEAAAEAQAAAEAAKAEAEAAKAEAEAAKAEAEAAQADAETAKAQAEAAQAAAETAQAAAETAQAAAETAKAEAETAKAQAEAAKADAVEAQTKAEAAKADAEATKSEIAQAQADAAAAQTAAEAAKADALAAQTAAEAAQTAAEAAAAQAEELYKATLKLVVKASKPTIKLTGKTKSVYVKISKVDNVDGYQIKYSTSSAFKSAKIKTTSKTSYTIKSLKKGKKYYVKVRGYKTIDGAKVYTKYSAKKSVKAK